MEIAYITLQGVSLKLVGIVEDDENFKPQSVFGYELERVSRIRDLRPQGVLITSTVESDRKMDRVKTYFEESPVCIKDVCLP